MSTLLQEGLLVGEELLPRLAFLLDYVDFSPDQGQPFLDGAFRVQHLRLFTLLDNLGVGGR